MHDCHGNEIDNTGVSLLSWIDGNAVNLLTMVDDTSNI